MLSSRDYELLAHGWDAAVNRLCYEDGTPLEVTNNINPFWPQVTEAIRREQADKN